MSVLSGKSSSVANVGKKQSPVYDGSAMQGMFGDSDISPPGKAAPKDKLQDPLVGLLASGVKEAGSNKGVSGQADSAV